MEAIEIEMKKYFLVGLKSVIFCVWLFTPDESFRGIGLPPGPVLLVELCTLSSLGALQMP